MKRLSIALSLLYSFNLLTEGFRWLLSSNLLPMGHLWLTVLVCIGVVALTYFATLEASPLYSLYAPEAKLYTLAAVIGCVTGLF